MLTSEEAISFVTDVLKIKTALDKRVEEPRNFLRELTKAYICTVPFQSATLISKPMEERRRPSLEEVKEMVLSGKGGVCYVMNIFLKYLLDALGYKTFFVQGSMYRPYDHVLMVLEGLETPGDKFLVDGGILFPAFEPFQLDPKKESKEYTNLFLKCSFKWEGEEVLIDYEYQQNDSPEPKLLKCKVDFTPRDPAYINKVFDEIYSNPDATHVHHVLLLGFYSKDDEKKARFVINSSHVLEDEKHLLEKTEIDSAEAFMKLVEQDCPALKIDAEKAIERLKLFS